MSAGEQNRTTVSGLKSLEKLGTLNCELRTVEAAFGGAVVRTSNLELGTGNFEQWRPPLAALLYGLRTWNFELRTANGGGRLWRRCCTDFELGTWNCELRTANGGLSAALLYGLRTWNLELRTSNGGGCHRAASSAARWVVATLEAGGSG